MSTRVTCRPPDTRSIGFRHPPDSVISLQLFQASGLVQRGASQGPDRPDEDTHGPAGDGPRTGSGQAEDEGPGNDDVKAGKDHRGADAEESGQDAESQGRDGPEQTG